MKPCSAMKAKTKEDAGRHLLLRFLCSGAITMHTEALLPGSAWTSPVDGK